jgi:Nif-specific regulatory protein
MTSSSVGTASPAEIAAELLSLASRASSAADLLGPALGLIASAVGAEAALLLQGEKARWRTVAAVGTKQTAPESLLTDALDGEQPVSNDEWVIIPLRGSLAPGELLALRGAARGRIPAVRAEQAGAWLASALAIVRRRELDAQQLARLSATLEISAHWQRTLDMDKLLASMAAASTKLLHAERATIFLWDRASHSLVGRPALGIEKGELRVADDAGIVGQVIQTGQSRRVDADIASEQREIDRRTDQRLKFQTRSLVCVPLRSRRGELFGAFEVINKLGGNFTSDDEQALEELAAHAAIALENCQEWQQLLSARQQVADQAAERIQLIGESPAIQALRSTVARIADTDLAVLVLGENGTGKEVIAQMIHYRSRRRQEPLVAVNCAAISETLLESELFGHEKGAFTDAREMRRGKFELAASGTLFLDEIGDMSLAGQAKLLRVLEEKTIVRVGGSTPIATNARVVAATNQKLAELVAVKRFREDLYFRLNVVTLELPPLRDRGEDVVLLAEHFLRHFAALARRKTLRFTAAAKKRLLGHSWPGNIRELRNMMERLAYLAPDDQDKVDAPDLAFILAPSAAASGAVSLDSPLVDATREFQIDYIRRTIERLRGNMTAAAEKLGLHRSNLYRKMRQLGMEE